MKPILFHIFGEAIPSYSVFMVLGYIAALAVIFKLTPVRKKEEAEADGGLYRPQVWDLFIVMVVSSVIGSKFGHVLFEAPGHKDENGLPINSLWELLKADPWHWARLGESGYVWYGGMIGALATSVFYFWRRPKLKRWLYADAFAPAIMIGAVLGRIGCFFAGCCHGKPTTMPWGVVMPSHGAMPIHPTQIYDSFIALVICALLMWRFPRRRFDGENIALLLMTYPVMRSITEIFRGDVERGTFGPLSTSQLLSIPLFGIGVFLWTRLSRAGSREITFAQSEPSRS